MAKKAATKVETPIVKKAAPKKAATVKNNDHSKTNANDGKNG